MRNIAIVGSGQAGLLMGHALLRAGYQVTLFSDRSPESWLTQARPTGTAVRFKQSLAFERELGLDQFHAQAPIIKGLKATILSHPAKPILTMFGRFGESPLAIDLRLQSATWMRALAAAGGRIVLQKVTPEEIDALSHRYDLTIVATGKEGGLLFNRDARRSPSVKPLRNLAMMNCTGASMRLPEISFPAAKLNILEGLGECYWTPYYHKDQKPVWNLVFEAKPGGRFDCFQAAHSGHEVLRIAKEVIRDMLPWDYNWIKDAVLADEHSWQTGAITPTVRDPVRTSGSGQSVIPLGDAYMTFDPIGAQGANLGNRLAKFLSAAIVARGRLSFDPAWIRSTYDEFYHRWGVPSMRWTQFLLEPLAPAARYLLVAQLGADGLTLGGSPKQQLADAFVGNFDDPSLLLDTLLGFRRTRSFVSRVLGLRSDWEAAKGLLTVGGRQLRNAFV